MSEKFSYSKIDIFSQCGFKYKLRYIDKHFVDTSSLATELGTAIHETEETIANCIKAKEPINYISLKNKLLLTMCELEHKYAASFQERDKSGRTPKLKIFEYLHSGIYRLEKFLMANNHLEVIATEQEFNLTYNNVAFHGFIDRILYDHHNKKYIVQDIKTYAVPIEQKNLMVPLQFIVYILAMKELYGISENQITCSYDLPFCDTIQVADTSDYQSRGIKKLDKLLQGIEAQDFVPKPSPLCHWCEFCPTNPNQREEAKNLCPYHSLWTKKNKTQAVALQWAGIENHDLMLFEYLKYQNSTSNTV